jgi:hypothetical protein
MIVGTLKPKTQLVPSCWRSRERPVCAKNSTGSGLVPVQ